MRKRLLSILLLCCMVLTLLPTATLAAGDVAINDTNFPDEIFRKYVEDGFDTNNDGFLSAGKIAAVKSIGPTDKNILSLKGVEHFTNLESLHILGLENLTLLHISENTALTSVHCERTKLTSLDTSQNEKLVYLRCENNPSLTTLDVSKNTKLKELYCGDNALTALDLTHNLALEQFDCVGNEFTILDLSKNTELRNH